MELTRNDLDMIVWGLDLLIEKSNYAKQNLDEMDDNGLTYESFHIIEYKAMILKNDMVEHGRKLMIQLNQKTETTNDTENSSTK